MCLLVCLSSFYRPHDICPLCGAASEWQRAGAVVSSGPARAGKHTQREHARAWRTTSQRKNRCADAFQKKTVRAHAVVYVTAEIFKKKEKENQHATSQVQFTLCLLLECILFESYLIFGRSRPWSARIQYSSLAFHINMILASLPASCFGPLSED